MGYSCCDTTNEKAVDVKSLHDNDLICYCEQVTKGQIVEAIQKGARSVKDVVDATGACNSASRCEELNPKKRCCAVDIMEVIKLTLPCEKS